MPGPGAHDELDSVVVNIVEQINADPQLEFKPCRGEPVPESSAHQLTMLLSLVARDPALFLERYGKHMNLAAINSFSDCIRWKGDYEVNWHLKSLLSKLQSSTPQQNKRDKVAIKNRRYTKLQSLIKEGDYFSYKNIKSRYPYLYHKYVGQYSVQQSEFNGNMPLSSRLMENMDEVNNRAQVEADQQAFRAMYPGSDEDSDGELADHREGGVEERGKKKVEEEEDEEEEEEEEEEDSVKVKQKIQSVEKGDATGVTTESAKDVNIDDNTLQLLDLVYQKFLLGEDVDFDYAEVDNNEKLDPEGVELDLEGKYFEDDSEDVITTNQRPNKDNDELYDY